MASAPIVTFTESKEPYSIISSISYAQSTLGSNYLPISNGENSELMYFRIYNNFDSSNGIATMDNIYVTVFDGADPNSHTATKSPVAQSWIRIYENGYGESAGSPGLYTKYVDEDTAIGRSGVDQYVPLYGSDGTSTPYIRAGSDGDGVGFIEFATYLQAPDEVGFASYSIALSVIYDWTS